MTSLGSLLDSLTAKAMELLKVEAPGGLPLKSQTTLQVEMMRLRIEARQLVKTIRRDVQEIKDGA